MRAVLHDDEATMLYSSSLTRALRFHSGSDKLQRKIFTILPSCWLVVFPPLKPDQIQSSRGGSSSNLPSSNYWITINKP
jgi:hypothetical protein